MVVSSVGVEGDVEGVVGVAVSFVGLGVVVAVADEVGVGVDVDNGGGVGLCPGLDVVVESGEDAEVDEVAPCLVTVMFPWSLLGRE